MRTLIICCLLVAVVLTGLACGGGDHQTLLPDSQTGEEGSQLALPDSDAGKDIAQVVYERYKLFDQGDFEALYALYSEEFQASCSFQAFSQMEGQASSFGAVPFEPEIYAVEIQGETAKVSYTLGNNYKEEQLVKEGRHWRLEPIFYPCPAEEAVAEPAEPPISSGEDLVYLKQDYDVGQMEYVRLGILPELHLPFVIVNNDQSPHVVELLFTYLRLSDNHQMTPDTCILDRKGSTGYSTVEVLPGETPLTCVFTSPPDGPAEVADLTLTLWSIDGHVVQQ